MTAPTYVCRFCRQTSDASAPSCPSCGAPVDVRDVVSRSGWEQQPAIKDMARIQFGQSKLQIEGTQVPVADFNLSGQEWIYFSHHVLLWADASTNLTNSSLAGGWNRTLAGMPLIMVEARGPGHVALSDDHAGDMIALPLHPGQAIWSREHRFLAATGNISYQAENTNVWFQTGTGNERETHYPLGMYGDRFTAEQSPGLLLLHSPGDTFVRDLAPGESILVQPSALLYRDISVTMHLHVEYPHAQQGMFSYSRNYSMRNVWLRLIGPGRIAVQSIFSRPENSDYISASSGATTQAW
jgi:uncharacterized protein (AIM24 family)